MEPTQTAQMVAWLDEERRKDKALITKLEERTSSQAALLEDQARRIQALEGELAALRSTTPTISFFDETIARLRSELNTAIEQAESRRNAVEQDAKKVRELDREAMTRALDDIRQEVSNRLERELQPRKAEEERLARVATELQNYADHLSRNLEEFERTLSFLEEQRRQDSRRLSDINGELLELTKRMEGQQSKADLLEELSRRNERAINELSGTMMEFKQQRQSWVEQEALAAQKREQIMGDMVRRMDAFAEDMAAFAKQVENWSETHRAMKKGLDDFNRLVDRVERRLNEVSEMQRLSEERFRTEWEEFLQDDQKRWRQFTLTNEEAWRSNAKRVEDMLGQLARLNERTDRLLEHLKLLTTAQQEILRTLSDSLQPVRERIDESIKAFSSLT
jgi:chromosome segregation ATPase